jgi:UDP-3-O-[3-hydroxymyristoyl] N-acetylglucosamine deacetylase/UDP-3-O-[3-hydroxymyristoyl] N-acetylglucosamine deacetylase/3-hydroxyacyl-[acyl-carrier-protein] dehydratase
VAVVEHVLAALAALRVDNCLVRLNAPEPPGCDGSAQPFVDLIDKAGVVRQDAWRPVLTVQECLTVTDTDDVGVAATPPQRDEYLVGYILNYGPGPITPQAAQIAVTPDLFRREIANSRTFVLEQEVQALRAAGIGRRATTQHLLVCGAQGPIENQLRNSTECARHKLLDCIGDFSLIGCDLRGRFVAQRSGHRHNHELIRELRRRYLATIPSDQTISAKAA